MSLDHDENDACEAAAGLQSRGQSAVRWNLLVGLSSLILPGAYVLGRTYRDAWIEASGLPSSAFSIEVHEALFYSYVAAIEFISACLERYAPWIDSLVAIWVGSLVSLVFLVSLFRWLSIVFGKVAAGTLSGWGRKIVKSGFAETFATAYLIASAPVLLCGVVLYAVLVGLVPAVVGEGMGKAAGGRFRDEAVERVRNNRYLPGDKFAVLRDAHTSEANLVALCGSEGCGLITANGSSFVLWDRVEVIKSQPQASRTLSATH